MRMGQGVRTGLGHACITCVLQTQFSSFLCHSFPNISLAVSVTAIFVGGSHAIFVNIIISQIDV